MVKRIKTEGSKEAHQTRSPKKKTNSSNSKEGGSKKSKNRKTAQTKAPLQQIQVKPKSTGNTAVDTISESGVIDNTGGFASGQFGTRLQTKRGENLCISFGLQKRHVEALYRAFKREEQLGTGEITTTEFFTMLHEQPRQLTKGMFEAVGLARNIKRLRFDDFVICVTTIATWSKSELLRYAFKQFDVDDSGVMDNRELRAFCEGLKNDSSFYFAKNVNIARKKLAARDHNNLKKQGSSQKIQLQNDIEDDALVDLEDLVKGSTEFQVAFYPLTQFQQNIRACALGEQFWSGVTIRCQQVELIVHYMELHKGKLPPISLVTSLLAVVPFSQAHKKVLVHKLAVLRYAEVQRQLHDQAQAKQTLRLTHIEEDKHTLDHESVD